MTLVLGITGTIASGKSSAAACFAELGAVTVSADQLAREVVVPGSATLAALVAAFGSAILTPAGELDREAVARLVFADPAARTRLNAITHPAIASLSTARLAALRAEGVPLVVSPSAITAFAPHPNAAKLFTDFIFSRDVQQVLADTEGLYSGHPQIKYPSDKPRLSDLKLLSVDAEELEKRNEEIKTRFVELFGA